MPQVIMPKMGDAMEEGTLLKWLKNQGDEVAEGDPLAEIETDKVTLEIEATDAGVLTRTLVGEGDTVPIGTPIATIGEDGEVPAEAEAAEQPAAEQPVAAQPAAVAEAPSTGEESGQAPPPAGEDRATQEERPAAQATQPSPTPPPSANGERAPSVATGDGGAPVRAQGERLRASPIVKRLAAEHGIDLQQVAGSGPGGRIVKDDIKDFISGARPAPQAAAAQVEQPTAPAEVAAAAPGQPAAPPAATGQRGTPVELSRIKQRTGERMAFSKQTIPHYYVTSDVAMDAAMAFREQVNAALGEDGTRLSVNDLIIKAAALALRENPNVNTAFEDGRIYQQPRIDINIAIALDGGLIAPFIPAADEKSLGAISRMAKDLGRRAREGGLKPEEYQGGTFTISNLGMFDIAEFIAVINPPQAAILAVGSVQELPVVRDGEVTVGQRMKITLSADHRALDGAEVARFLQAVTRYLQNPMLLALS
jgi:pyruvate dehydrogenase E2 component (dihydrolipoamide acetyltransferase)